MLGKFALDAPQAFTSRISTIFPINRGLVGQFILARSLRGKHNLVGLRILQWPQMRYRKTYVKRLVQIKYRFHK